jgi:hypothetical protein
MLFDSVMFLASSPRAIAAESRTLIWQPFLPLRPITLLTVTSRDPRMASASQVALFTSRIELLNVTRRLPSLIATLDDGKTEGEIRIDNIKVVYFN